MCSMKIRPLSCAGCGINIYGSLQTITGVQNIRKVSKKGGDLQINMLHDIVFELTFDTQWLTSLMLVKSTL